MTYWFLTSGNSQRDYSTFFEASTKCYPPPGGIASVGLFNTALNIYTKKQIQCRAEKFTIPNQPGCLPGQRTPDVVCWCPPFINILCNCVDTGQCSAHLDCCTLGREIETIVLGSGGRVGARKLC